MNTLHNKCTIPVILGCLDPEPKAKSSRNGHQDSVDALLMVTEFSETLYCMVAIRDMLFIMDWGGVVGDTIGLEKL